MFSKALTLVALAATAQSAALLRRHDNASSTYTTPALVPLAPATYDGECFYPTPDQQFNLSTYTGRWYQLAGTFVPFTAGCECVFAEYGLNDNGTVSVFNSCQLPSNTSTTPREIAIRGEASRVSASYGLDGVFQVKFPGPPQGGDCANGPNYIVQSYDEVDGWAIVQAGNFTTLFLLSREQERTEKEVTGWLARAGRLGTDLSKVVRTKQSGCLYT